MVQIETDVREKVESLLKDLFQFDNQELDFGIYRIMNFKRKEIEKFIKEDLIAKAESQFKEYSQAGQDTLRNELEKLKNEIIRDFGAGTIDDQGVVRKNEDAPKIKEYIKKVEELRGAEVSEVQVNEVFNRIYEFFSRYYDKGDIMIKVTSFLKEDMEGKRNIKYLTMVKKLSYIGLIMTNTMPKVLNISKTTVLRLENTK